MQTETLNEPEKFLFRRRKKEMKIEKVFNKKSKIYEHKARFQLNRREFYLKAATRKELLELVDEVRMQENRQALGLPAPTFAPCLSDLFARHEAKIASLRHRTLFNRVSEKFLSLLPSDITVTEIRRAHFQLYIDSRLQESGVQTKRPILPQTINKELYAISAAFANAPLYYPSLDSYRKPVVPRIKCKRARRERLVSREKELDIILEELRKPRAGKQTERHHFHRVRLADTLEFALLTGMRRKEIARLEWRNYFPSESALRDVVRWKTDTVTKFFPLPVRAIEIIEQRRQIQGDLKFIFSPDGEPVEANYRTLQTVCSDLNIPYGRFTSGGFTAHDLRHNFATEIVQVTDIETAKSLTGHSGNEIFTYLHTTERRQREAIRKRENKDSAAELIELYKGIKRGKIKARKFLGEIRNLAGV